MSTSCEIAFSWIPQDTLDNEPKLIQDYVAM